VVAVIVVMKVQGVQLKNKFRRTANVTVCTNIIKLLYVYKFSTRPDRPWGPPSLLYNGYRVIPGDKSAGAWR
jgi:hypothetical protein